MPSALVCIVEHESGGQQFNADGSPLESPTHDFGVMQINAGWIPTAKKMGLDVVHSEADNINFGMWLAKTRGLSQWATYSEYCDGGKAS